MEKKTVVLYPGAGVGHLAPMLELAKALLRHAGDQVDVAIVVVEPPVYADSFAATVARAKASNASVAFHVLPPPASDGDAEPDDDPLTRLLRFLRATNAPLRDFLRALSASRRVQAIVLDMFCAGALDVAADLALPAYFHFASGAAGLAYFLGLPAMRASVGTSFAELGGSTVLSFPGVPPLTVADLPQGVLNDSEACRVIMGAAARMPDARGILINSFESLEPRAMRALRDGLCVPGRATPPVYCVGPMVSPGGDGAGHECLRWLDAQPDRSVVFLCFGSLGTFPKRQLEEIAVGLERSGQRFLWVVRSPPGGPPADDVRALLPAGFAERTEGRGLVVASWAPQVDVLRHRAAGAFVTHCGWNSTLEGVVAGLPLLCWPLYAEQRMNKVRIVEEMKLGVEVRRDGEGLVTAQEVEAKVRWVMQDSDGARELKERAEAARARAAEALAEGGPSRAAFLEFVLDLLASEGMVNV